MSNYEDLYGKDLVTAREMNNNYDEARKQAEETRANQEEQLKAHVEGNQNAIEDYDDVITEIQKVVAFLKRQGNGRGASREASLAVAKLEEAEMWIDRHLDISDASFDNVVQ